MKTYGLQDRIALITGGSKGIGKAIASSFINEGVKTSICARNKEGLEKTKKEIQKGFEGLLTIEADITQEDESRLVIQL